MLSQLGHKNFTLLGKMLDLTAKKHQVISQNISNVNTPNYRRRELDFSSSLKNALSAGTKSAYSSVEGIISRPNTTAVRNNGNNVDIDMEMVDLNENAALYKIYSQMYAKRVGSVKKAIKGGG